MNGEFTDRDGSALSVDVLADLHAGVLSESEAAELWPRVNADPEARAVIEALEATTSDLSSLTDEPVEPMPADVAARLDAAIAGEQRAREQQGTTNVVGLDRARSRRKKQAGWAAGFVAVAAAAVAAVAVVLPGAGGGDSTPGVAEPAPSEPAPSQPNSQPDTGTGDGPLALSSDRGELSAAVNDINQVRDFGTLQTKERLDSLDKTLTDRMRHDVADLDAVLSELERAITKELRPDEEGSELYLPGLSPQEMNQVTKDIAALEARLARIPEERLAEEAAIMRQYADPVARTFPAAVIFLVPESMAVRG